MRAKYIASFIAALTLLAILAGTAAASEREEQEGTGQSAGYSAGESLNIGYSESNSAGGWGAGISSGSSISTDGRLPGATDNNFPEIRAESELENERRQAEFDKLWADLENEERARSAEWQKLLDDFESLPMTDYDEEVFLKMQESISEASGIFAAKHGNAQVIIADAMQSFYHGYSEAGETINSFFDRFWSENQAMSVKLAMFSESFEAQNALIQDSLDVMDKYVSGRIAAMSAGAGYGSGVTEYVPPEKEEVKPDPADRLGAHLLAYTLIGSAVALVLVAVLGKSVTGRFHQ